MPAVTTPGQPSWPALISRAMMLIASKDAEKGDGPLSPKCLAVLDTLRGMRDEPDPEAFTGPGDPLFKSYRSYRKNADQWQPDKGPRGGNRWRRGSVVRYFPDGVNPNQTGATDRASRNAVRGAAKAERQKLTADAAHAQLADVFASGEVPEDAPDRVHAVLSGMYRDEVRKLGVLLGTSQTGAMKDLVAKVAEAAVGRAKAGGWKRAEAPSPVDHVAAAAAMHQEARDQLATYEQAYTAAGGTPDAHRQALKASGLTGEGLRHARKVAGKFGTKGPGIATARAGADVPAEGSQRENGDVFVQGLWYPPSKPVMASGLPESARPKPYQDTPAAPPAHARAQAEAIAHAKGRSDRLRARGMTDDADHYAQVADYLGSADASFWTQHAAGRGVEQVTQVAGELMGKQKPATVVPTSTPITPPLGAKPADVAALREAMGETGPKEGDRNERGEVLRGGRWHQDREEEAVAKRQPADAYAAGKQNAGDGANGYNQAIHGLAAVIKERTGRDVSAGDIADRWHNPLASVRGSENWPQVEQMIRGAYRSPGDPPNAWWVTQGVRDYGYTSHALENQMDDFVRNKAPGIKDWAAGVREQAQDMQAIVPDFDGAAKAIAKADYWEKAVDQHVERFKQTIAAKKEADAEAFRKEQESQKFSRDMGTVELKVPQTAGLMKRLRESSPGMLTLAQEQGWFTDGKVLFRLSPKEKAEADKLPATGSKPPDIQSVLEPAKKARATEAAEVTGHRKSPKDAKMTEFHLSDGKRQASVDGALFETIRRRFPKATAHLGRKPSDPILFRQGDEVVGLLMPLTRPDDFKAEYKDAESTVTKRYPRPACPSSWRHRYHA